MAKLSALQDAFTGSSLNTAVWNQVSGGTVTVDTVNDLAVIPVATTAGAYVTLGAGGPWDATGSALSAQITPPGYGAGQITTYMKVTGITGNAVQLQLTGTSLQLYVQTGGTWTLAATLPSYDPHQHRWWRLSETGGTWAAATSVDGLSWTTQATAAYTWSATAVSVAFQTGTVVAQTAGLVATVAHVNTTAGGPANPNWPVMEVGWGARWWANGGDSPLDRYVDIAPRTRGTTAVARGRQYELDQPQSGTLDLTLDNRDSALDPTNTAGPWAGHIQPYQPVRVRAQWPPTRNLLTQVQATAGDLGGQPLGTINTGNNGPSIFSDLDVSGGQFVTSSTAWQGSTVMQFAVPITSPNGNNSVVWTPQVDVLPGTAVTQQIRARNITASTSLPVAAYIAWLDATGARIGSIQSGAAATLTGAATAWTTLTVTATAPANAAVMDVGLYRTATPAAACTIQVDGWQVEHASTASAWCCPGVWYPVYAGYVERWPSSWQLSGTWGQITPTCVDALSLLSQVQLSDPLTESLTAHQPRFLYRLDDPDGSASAADQTGNNGPAPLSTAKLGAGSWSFGTDITAADPANGVFTGSSGTVATIANPSPAADLYAPATYLSLYQAGIHGPTGGFGGTWTRAIAIRYTGPTPTSGNSAVFWTAMDNAKGYGSFFQWCVNDGGRVEVALGGPSGLNTGFEFGSTSVMDKNWHLLTFGYSASKNELTASIDGQCAFWGGVNTATLPTAINADSVGAWIDPSTGNDAAWNYQGDLAFVTEWPSYLSSSDIAELYAAWRNACAGESSGARYQRILRYAGYTGPQNVQTGSTTNMGPASDLAGTDALSALQAVVTTENGEHFADASGTMTFRARTARYNALTPTYVFGERADLGEWPYEACELDYDSTHLANVVAVTQTSTGQVFAAQDTSSQNLYFPRSMARSINSGDPSECQDAANYLLGRYRDPATRVSSLTLHPSAYPQMWPVCLSLELGMRVRVMRRSAASTAQVDCFVENLAWSFTDAGEATLTLQCSPVDLSPYVPFASFHTTLRAAVSAGATTVTINPGQDTANPAAAQIGAGQQLVLGQGTANAETVTVKNVAATASGWSSCVLTLTAATTKAHAVGDVVCEPLPAGITNPAVWDAGTQFDNCVFAY